MNLNSPLSSYTISLLALRNTQRPPIGAGALRSGLFAPLTSRAKNCDFGIVTSDPESMQQQPATSSVCIA